MEKPNHPNPIDQPDPRLLNTLAFVRQINLIAVASVSTVLLCAWISPSVAHHFPAGWDLMRPNTAICALLCAVSLTLANPRPSSFLSLIRSFLAVVVILLATAVLYECSAGTGFRIEMALSSDIVRQHPGRMSPHSAFCFLLLGVIILCIHARRQIVSFIVDALTLCVVFLILVYTSGYCFGVIQLFGTSMRNRISPQTLFCLSLLTIVVLHERARSRPFSVILGGGIAGKNARLALPFTLTVPFLIAVLRDLAVKKFHVQPDYATALTSSGSAMLFFCLILLLSLRIATLEQEIRDLSLRDELTSLYNRRGFYILATHDLQLANRAGHTFFVLFFDIDNLKKINDTLGHKTGSKLLREFAGILSSSIRATDIVGRLGGDEFVIAGNASESEIQVVVKRINVATSRVNDRHGRPYLVRYSLGQVTSMPKLSESLDDLLDQADKIMYQAKRDKRTPRAGTSYAVETPLDASSN